MNHLYDLAEWDSFFVAEVGAAAALTGLLFVAVSNNLDRILQFPKLPSRAAETMSLLLLSITSSPKTTTESPRQTVLSADFAAPWLRHTTSQACASRAPSESGNGSSTNTSHMSSPSSRLGPSMTRPVRLMPSESAAMGLLGALGSL